MLRRQFFSFGHRRLAGQHAVEIGRRAAMVRFANAVDVAGRAGAVRKVAVARPIHLVVPRAAAGPGEIRNFVLLEASGREPIDCQRVHVALQLFVDFRKFAVQSSTPKRGASFERQAIGRNMIWLECDGRILDRPTTRREFRPASRRSDRAQPAFLRRERPRLLAEYRPPRDRVPTAAAFRREMTARPGLAASRRAPRASRSSVDRRRPGWPRPSTHSPVPADGAASTDFVNC